MDAPSPLTVEHIVNGWPRWPQQPVEVGWQDEPAVYECPDCPARIAVRGDNDNLNPATRMFWHIVHAHDGDERGLVARAP